MVVQSKTRAKEILQRLLDSIPALHQSSVGSQGFTKWRRDTRVAIENIFGQDSRQVNEFVRIDYSPMSLSVGENRDIAFRNSYLRGLAISEAILRSMIDEIDEYWPDNNQVQNSSATPETQKQTNTNQVFIIHGRDTGTTNTVARFLEKLDLIPKTLQEQPDLGRTIIEKFEEHAQVDFAIALFTPDDLGGLDGGNQQHRARQNVIFEFGYFIGKYGRDRTRALVKGDIEIPSDYSGVIYISMDDSNDWQTALFRELKNAGFGVDANRLFE